MTSPPITWKWGDPVPGPEPDPSFVPLHGLSWPPPDADADDVDLDDDDEDLTTDASLVIHMHVGDAFDPSKHPRGGKPENTGEFSNAPGGGSTASVAVKGGGSLQVHVHPETAPGSGGQAAEGRTKAEPESAPLAPPKGIPAEHIRQMTALPIMETPAKYKPGQRTVGEVGKELAERGQQWLKAHGVRSGRLDAETSSPPWNDVLADAIAEETKAALKGHDNAATWYSDKVEEAVRVASLIHPEIGKDPNARAAFALALAVTSQGETVGRSAELADWAFRQWKQNGGRFGITEMASRNGGPMIANLKKYDDLVAKLGPDEARKFLNSEMTIRDLVKLGFKKPGGTSMDQTVNGSIIFGPKIGGGFYQNLSGNYEPVTQDLWFMRTFGRLAGTLRDTVKTEKGKQETWARFNRALAESGVVVGPNEHAKMAKLADQIYVEHERNFSKFGAEYKSGARQKTELVHAAERIDHMLNGIQEMPGGAGDRAWRVGIVNRAREKLQAEGSKLTNADLQATIWYPEKDLWKRLGSKGPRGGNEDYSGALQQVARKAGHTDAELRQALGRDPDPVPVPKPVRAAAGAGRRDLGGTHDGRGERDLHGQLGQVVGRTLRGLIIFHRE